MVRGSDGRVFIDRDGEAFAHVLNWLRSPGSGQLDLAGASSSMVRRVQSEFGFFNIELLVEREVAVAAGGYDNDGEPLASVEQRGLAAVPGLLPPLPAVLANFCLCSLGEGSVYAVGGGSDDGATADVHRYDMQAGAWSAQK